MSELLEHYRIFELAKLKVRQEWISSKFQTFLERAPQFLNQFL